ncbi:hypothetical protein BH09PAT1_BH09PAT1_2840 [soil metagenome]
MNENLKPSDLPKSVDRRFILRAGTGLVVNGVNSPLRPLLRAFPRASEPNPTPLSDISPLNGADEIPTGHELAEPLQTSTSIGESIGEIPDCVRYVDELIDELEEGMDIPYHRIGQAVAGLIQYRGGKESSFRNLKFDNTKPDSSTFSSEISLPLGTSNFFMKYHYNSLDPDVKEARMSFKYLDLLPNAQVGVSFNDFGNWRSNTQLLQRSERSPLRHISFKQVMEVDQALRNEGGYGDIDPRAWLEAAREAVVHGENSDYATVMAERLGIPGMRQFAVAWIHENYPPGGLDARGEVVDEDPSLPGPYEEYSKVPTKIDAFADDPLAAFGQHLTETIDGVVNRVDNGVQAVTSGIEAVEELVEKIPLDPIPAVQSWIVNAVAPVALSWLSDKTGILDLGERAQDTFTFLQPKDVFLQGTVSDVSNSLESEGDINALDEAQGELTKGEVHDVFIDPSVPRERN